MKKMKQHVATSHQSYGSYSTAGSMAPGYPLSKPSTKPSGTYGHLPAIPQSNPFMQNGLRLRPASGLQLSVKALPNSTGIQSTLPRERPPQMHRLSSSDSKALEQLRAPTSLITHNRRNSSGEHILRAKGNLGRFQEEANLLPLSPRRPPSSSMQHRQLAGAEILPPIAGTMSQDKPVSPIRERALELSEDEDTDSETSSDLEDELFSEGSEAPPSRPGFESDVEQSGHLFNVPFPDMNKDAPFPATLIQDHSHLDNDRFTAGTNVSGLSPRVDNIVRAFRIHGPLDKQLLQQALNQVASLHSLLTASFQRTRERLYVQVMGGEVCVTLDSPVIGHEHPDDLIMNARRKIFHLPMRNNIVSTTRLLGGSSTLNDDLNVKVFSVTSVMTGSDSSDASKSPVSGRALVKKVSFASANTSDPKPATVEANSQLPSVDQAPTVVEEPLQPLVRAKLSSKNPQEHILVLSFPRIVCDYWSSCLFAYQLSDAYAKLEKSSSYRPSLAVTRIESRRQAVINAHDKMRAGSKIKGRDAASRLLQKRTQGNQQTNKGVYLPPHPYKLHFQQIAQRESQLLLMLSRERLWTFWESMVTAIIRRQRGPNRVKVVPPVRIPSGLGEKRVRPQTSRLRPLTASRNRPQTAKRGSGLLGDIGISREALVGPKTKFHNLKIEEQVCDSFKQSLPELYLSHLKEDETLFLLCLGAYVLLLGKCCRGWGLDEGARTQGNCGNFVEGSQADLTIIASEPIKQKLHYPRDPLQEYKVGGTSRAHKTVVQTDSSPGTLRSNKRSSITGKLDLGSFLIGLDTSLRHSEPQQTQGLFGPLSNDVGVRVNLDPRESFADLILSLWRSILLARKHGHFPFSTIAEEVGLIRGLPIKFSYYYHDDIVQLTNPNEFYFSETAIGVEGQGLARFGSSCYLTPLNGKMDDSCHMELVLWESFDGNYVIGGIRYQPQIIKTELVESFGRELVQLISAISQDPCKSALKFAQEIHPPFLNSSRTRKHRSYRKPTAGL